MALKIVATTTLAVLHKDLSVKIYAVTINGSEVMIGVIECKIFNVSNGQQIKIKNGERLMSWLYDHDAIPA